MAEDPLQEVIHGLVANAMQAASAGDRATLQETARRILTVDPDRGGRGAFRMPGSS